MPGKRPIKKGSFGGHFEELVKHFPHDAKGRAAARTDERALQEKRDIHALLFERAWQLDRQGEGSAS